MTKITDEFVVLLNFGRDFLTKKFRNRCENIHVSGISIYYRSRSNIKIVMYNKEKMICFDLVKYKKNKYTEVFTKEESSESKKNKYKIQLRINYNDKIYCEKIINQLLIKYKDIITDKFLKNRINTIHALLIKDI